VGLREGAEKAKNLPDSCSLMSGNGGWRFAYPLYDLMPDTKTTGRTITGHRIFRFQPGHIAASS